MPDPIQDLDSVDVIGKRKDGGVTLFIAASSRLDGSPEHQKLLFQKVKDYLAFIASDDFREEFGSVPADKIVIMLEYVGDIHPVMFEVFKRCEGWVEQSGARFRAAPHAAMG